MLDIDVAFPKNFRSIVQKILNRLFRVYAHIYHSHFQKIIALGEEAHINTSLKVTCTHSSHTCIANNEIICELRKIHCPFPFALCLSSACIERECVCMCVCVFVSFVSRLMVLIRSEAFHLFCTRISFVEKRCFGTTCGFGGGI